MDNVSDFVGFDGGFTSYTHRSNILSNTPKVEPVMVTVVMLLLFKVFPCLQYLQSFLPKLLPNELL